MTLDHTANCSACLTGFVWLIWTIPFMLSVFGAGLYSGYQWTSGHTE
jgi:hypothetical protein